MSNQMIESITLTGVPVNVIGGLIQPVTVTLNWGAGPAAPAAQLSVRPEAPHVGLMVDALTRQRLRRICELERRVAELEAQLAAATAVESEDGDPSSKEESEEAAPAPAPALKSKFKPSKKKTGQTASKTVLVNKGKKGGRKAARSEPPLDIDQTMVDEEAELLPASFDLEEAEEA